MRVKVQVSIGVTHFVLERTHTELQHMESKWIASLRMFLAEIQASILLDEPQVPPLQSEGDRYLMDFI